MFDSIIYYQAFLIASTIMTLTPGIDTAIETSVVIKGGRTSGIGCAIGISLGVLCQSLFAGLGLVVIFYTFDFVFNAIKIIGAIYLLYLGYKAFFASRSLNNYQIKDSLGFNKSLLTGFLGDALNPKITIFIVTFYPQFINQSYQSSIIPYLILGISYAIIALIWYMIYAFIADKLLGKLGNRLAVIMTKITAIVLIIMGVLSLFFTL